VNRFRLSRQAEQDLDDIWAYLSEQDPVVADTQVAQLLDRFRMLSQFPSMGKSRDELMESLRSFPVKPYVIFYRPILEAIEILRILHQSREIKRQLF